MELDKTPINYTITNTASVGKKHFIKQYLI